MKSLGNLVSRSLLGVAAVGLALAMTPGAARAGVTFTVDEGAVSGANDVNVTADGLTGKYLEEVTLDSSGPGTFSATIVVNFTAYTLGSSPTTDQIGAATGDGSDANLYSLYALVTVSGTYTATVLGSGNTIYEFEPDDGAVDFYTDALRDTTTDYTTATATGGTADDEHLLHAEIVDTASSYGSVTLSPSGTVLSGSYALGFTDVTVEADGTDYWPTLYSLALTLLASSGDVDPPEECSTCVFPTIVAGDTSIAFDGTAVPEPATLTLLGIGLASAGFAARRRRHAA